MKNIGPASWRMLARADIPDISSLRALGPAMAFVLVEEALGNASLNLLYAMAAGLEERHWCDLSPEEKGRLLREVEDLRALRADAVRDMHSRAAD